MTKATQREQSTHTIRGLWIAIKAADARQMPGLVGKARQCFDENLVTFPRSQRRDTNQMDEGIRGAARELCRISPWFNDRNAIGIDAVA